MIQLFTSESVTEGHPDKVSDLISDAILDAYITLDSDAHVACETCVTTNNVLVMGEISSNIDPDINVEKVVRDTIRDIGYIKDEYGFNADCCNVQILMDKQSEDIRLGVNRIAHNNFVDTSDFNSIGAGDQGLIFGFACDETPVFMPLPINLAHKLAKKLSDIRKSGDLSYLRPDGKTQVTIEYKNGKPVRIDTIVVSAQHDPNIKLEQLKLEIKEKVIMPVIPKKYINNDIKFHINPTGRFVIGGPQGDSGLTGRKIMVDTYGGMARHGGGAFSGKDSTKVDRAAAYALRYLAKNIVAAGYATKCEIQAAYAIGVPQPVSVYVETFGTNLVSQREILGLVKYFDLRPAAIIDRFALKRPIYKKTAAYGHFGRTDISLPWEKLDLYSEIVAAK